MLDTSYHAGNGEGWIQSNYIRINNTDLDAQLYHVKDGENLSTIVQKHYAGKIEMKTGQDARLLVHAVAHLNEMEKTAGISFNAQDKDSIDWYRKPFLGEKGEESLSIWNSIKITSGHNIWLPSVGLVNGLKESGAISSGSVRANIQKVAEYALFYPGLQIGVFEGLWEGFKGIFTGIAELAKLVWELGESIIKGELKAYLTKIWEGIKAAVLGLPDSLKKAWEEFTAKSPFNQGRAVGKIVGMIVLEVLIAYFTAGIGTAIKWVGNGGKFLRAFRAADNVMDAAKDLPKGKLPTPDAKQIDAIGDAVSTTAKTTRATAKASRAANWSKIKNLVGQPAKGVNLPDGYSFYTRGNKRHIRRKTADDDLFAQIHVDKDGLIQPGPSRTNNRLSKAAAVTRSIGKAWPGHNRHHIIPDNVVRDNPLFQKAIKNGKPPYDLDNRANLEQLAKTDADKIVGKSDHLPTHSGSHPNYDKMVRGEADKAIDQLKAKFGSLDNVDPEILAKMAIRVQDRVRIKLEAWPEALN